MRTRSLVGQGVLAAVALAAAVVVGTREPAGEPGEVVVRDIPARALLRVRHEDGAGWVELFREPAEAGALWLRWSTPPRALRAHAPLAEALFARFAPLRAARSLGVLDAAHRAQVGLTASPRVLRLGLTGGGEHVFHLAAPASGWRGPYLLREPEGDVFLLSPGLLPDLENGAARLVDRTLHTFGPDEVEAFTVSREGASRTVRLPAPQAEEALRRWYERLTLLAPAAGDFLGRDEAPPGGPPEEEFRVDYARGMTPLGHLVVARTPDGTRYARTEHTVGWARLAPWTDSLGEEARSLLTPPAPRP